MEGTKMKLFEIEELEQMNGKDGKPCCIAYKNRVYDVSGSKLWATGVHMRIHPAGSDLTDHLPKAPHGPEVLKRYPQIGTVHIGAEPASEPKKVQTFALLERVPFLKRHPHPMVVHFPIALFVSASLFYILYLILGFESLETTTLHCLIAGVAFTPLGIGTGYLTWMINYDARPIRAVRMKIVCSQLLLALSAGLLIWRLIDPTVAHGTGSTLPYSILLIALTPLVSIIGWYGGQLTIPHE